MRAAVVVLLLSSVFFIGLSGCTTTPGPTGAATPGSSSSSTTVLRSITTDNASESARRENPAGSAETGPPSMIKIGRPGERRNPIPMHQEARVGGWEIAVVGADLDATQAVLDENVFNAAPGEGSRYVLVSVEATNVGGGPSTFWLDMLCSFVGSKGGSFKTAAVVPPDSIMTEGEAPPGVRIAGNLVFEVPSDEVAGGTLMLEEAFSLEKSRMFFALE